MDEEVRKAKMEVARSYLMETIWHHFQASIAVERSGRSEKRMAKGKLGEDVWRETETELDRGGQNWQRYPKTQENRNLLSVTHALIWVRDYDDDGDDDEL